MRRIYLVLLVVTGGLALLWVLLFAGHRAPVQAAPAHPGAIPNILAGPISLPALQTVITCNITITTTDALPGINSFDTAANLANYSGLALVAGPPGPRVAEEDYFVLGSATPGFSYQVEAVPDGAGNYNLGLIVYDQDHRAIITDTNTLDGNSAKVTLNASAVGPYYFKVLQISNYCTGGTYHLTVSTTSTPGADAYEPNNAWNTAYKFPVSTSASATNANFWPVPDTDYYGFYVRNGQRYQAYTHDLSGVDTFMELYDKDGNEITSDNDSGGGFASRIEWTASYGENYYYVCITNRVSSTSADTYDLTIVEISATPTVTSTPAPTATPVAGLDSCENNYDFDHACVIPANQSLNFNFISPFSGPDNDYFKIWVKPGLRFDCRTSDLSPGVDPNMIIYDQNRNGIAGNDDVSPGDYNSALSYFATYEGWLYILVGTGNRTPPNLSASNYTLRCDVVAPGTATPVPTRTPAPTSEYQPPTAAPPASPTPAPGLTWRLLTTPPPSATVATPSAPRFIPISLLVYYDANNDGQPGAGEGIAGLSAEAYDTSTGQMLAQGFTGAQGNLEFTVASVGPVRVSVPFFGFSQLVAGEGGAGIYLRVPPSLP